MKSLIILIFCVAILPKVFSQAPPTSNLVNVSTKSPDAASLGKFGEVPVNTNTGATSITIPLMDITVGRIDIPLSLDYHTGGIRVDETASSVGLGWALSGIGVLSRNVVGLPDEGAGGYFGAPPLDSFYNNWSHGGGQYGSSFDIISDQFLYSFQNGIAETQPDIFSYSLAKAGGKFVFRKDHSIFQIPKTNNVITPVGAAYTITDENGVIYVFDLVEHVTQPHQLLNYVGSWRLSKMIDPFTVDTVYFSYESACGVNTENSISYVYNFGTGPNCSTGNGVGNIDYTGETSSTSSISHIDELFPTQIRWRGGKIVFSNACGRTDKASEKRLDEVDVYASTVGGYRQTKAVKLYQSYFYSNVFPVYTATDERNYRLRLDSVAELPVGTTDQPAVYRVTYRNISMAPRESTGVDEWGFNNGKFTNPSFMPMKTVLYNTTYHNIGEANRDVDTMYMQACMISSIQYPTGGTSVFEFEPHQYPTNISYATLQGVGTNANGSVQSTATLVYTPDPQGSAVTINYSFSAYNVAGVTDRPRITITDRAGGTPLTLSANSTPSMSFNSGPTPWNPVMGHTYDIVINLYTTTAAITGSIAVSWVDIYTNIPVNPYGGGLRTRAVTNYDNTGAFISRDLYKYGVGETGLGQLLTPETYLLVTSIAQNYKCGYSSNSDCIYYTGSNGMSYLAQPVYAATQFSGSPVLYSSVTKYRVDASGNPVNGKTEYQYAVFDDQPAFASTDYPKVGVLLITDGWRNGFLGYQNDYTYSSSSGYQLVHQKVNNYTASRQESLAGIIMKNNYNWNTSECHIGSMATDNSLYLLVQIPINSGATLLTSTVDNTYDTYNNAFSVTTNYTYGDVTHLFPTSSQFTDSKSHLTTENLKYPHDLSSAGNVYSTMVQRNMIAPVVQHQTVYNGTQTHQSNTNYLDVSGIGTVLQPVSIDERIAGNPIETRVQFNLYDKYGNILQQQKTGDQYNSYVWDYQSLYPVAQCTNAASGSIAFASFEADGTGGWTIGSGTTITTSSVDGRASFQMTSPITKGALSSSTTYIVSYWTQNGSAYSISGTVAGYPIQGKTVNINGANWTYFQHKVTGQSTISVTGTGVIDCLRLYPANAQMLSFTYDPLIGMTSSCSADDKITYYQYDGLGRLKLVKDQDGNIIKTIDYHFGAHL